MNLNTPISQLARVGPIYTRRLGRLGIREVKDLLFHFPHRYQDLSKITAISDVGLGDTVTITGKILDIQNIRSPRRRMNITEAIVEDASGAIRAVWFNQPYLIDNMRPGVTVVLSGKTTFSNDSLCLSSPSYEVTSSTHDLSHTGRIIPIYPETAGVSSRWFRYVIKLLLPLADKIPEYLPRDILARQNLPELPKALKDIHFPESIDTAEDAKTRIAFGELFLIQTVALKEKMKLKKIQAPKITFDLELAKEFVSSLPFTLTNSQRKAAWEILQDLEKPHPMNRLLEGDVGSGKTVVAALAALQTIKSGHQVALMVPTEILAEQHFRGLTQFLDPYKITVAILTRSAHKKTSQKIKYAPFSISKTRVAKETAEGSIDIIIGTHSLIQETVRFKNLGLIIIDEQHRFGVDQRAKLSKTKSKSVPHLLSMTATPIPRTLSLTVWGDLDLSLIKELPLGRKRIITKTVSPAGRNQAYEFIHDQIKQGRQAFVICPLIEESDKLEAKAATKEYEKLQNKIFPDFKISLLHGKMKGKEKEKIMETFKNKEVDILVSTSVVEVGIDIPNATVMLIEGADRFGLAQLYQFRGRVGRGEHQSYCFLFTDSTAKNTHQRLKALITAKNSFELAEEDLKIRGPGDFIGSRQSGIPSLAMASLSDLEFVKEVRKEVEGVLAKDPDLTTNPRLLEKYEQFQKEIHFE